VTSSLAVNNNIYLKYINELLKHDILSKLVI